MPVGRNWTARFSFERPLSREARFVRRDQLRAQPLPGAPAARFPSLPSSPAARARQQLLAGLSPPAASLVDLLALVFLDGVPLRPRRRLSSLWAPR